MALVSWEPWQCHGSQDTRAMAVPVQTVSKLCCWCVKWSRTSCEHSVNSGWTQRVQTQSVRLLTQFEHSLNTECSVRTQSVRLWTQFEHSLNTECWVRTQSVPVWTQFEHCVQTVFKREHCVQTVFKQFEHSFSKSQNTSFGILFFLAGGTPFFNSFGHILRFLRNIFAIFVRFTQYFCNICAFYAIFVRYLCVICAFYAIFLQYLCVSRNIFAIFVRCICVFFSFYKNIAF